MRYSIYVLCLALSLSVQFKTNASAQVSWTQVVLLQSTRADVEKLFGKPIGENYSVTYNLRDGVMYLEYYLYDRCKPKYGYRGDWNIPEWTVTDITFEPDNPPQFSSLKLDLHKFRKVRKSPNVPEMVSYINDTEGVEYTLAVDGRTVQTIRYFPGRRFNNLRCANDSAATAVGSLIK